MGIKENVDLTNALKKAYEATDKKEGFLKHLSTLPGVLLASAEHSHCSGYMRCMRDWGRTEELYLISYESRQVKRTFLIHDYTAFVSACNDVIEKKLNHKSPEKVAIKMVAARMRNILSYVILYNVQFSARKETPELSSKKAYVGWLHSNSDIVDFAISHRRMSSNMKLREIIDREDISDEMYVEAWKLIQVEEVMTS